MRQLTSLLTWLCLVLGANAQEISAVRAGGKQFTVCRVDLKKQRLEIFWRDDSNTPFKAFDRLNEWLEARGRKLIFAMNAGMYHGDFSPVGLYVEKGTELRPLNLKAGEGNFFLRPNGVFAVTASGAHIVESSKYPALAESATLATQSGPLLVVDGKLHLAFRQNSESQLYRNGVGVVSSDKVVFVISEDPVNFWEFATFFRDALKCRNALFLDGTISSLFSSQLRRSDKRMDLGPIIAITAER